MWFYKQLPCIFVRSKNKKLKRHSANPSHFLAGSSTYPNSSFGWINVKDVALAHVLAYEVPSANGRYCMVEVVAHHSDLVNIIHQMYPTIFLPDK